MKIDLVQYKKSKDIEEATHTEFQCWMVLGKIYTHINMSHTQITLLELVFTTLWIYIFGGRGSRGVKGERNWVTYTMQFCLFESDNRVLFEYIGNKWIIFDCLLDNNFKKFIYLPAVTFYYSHKFYLRKLYLITGLNWIYIWMNTQIYDE